MEKKEKKEFRVKFTGSEKKKSLSPNKEMILGGRQRSLKDLGGGSISIKPDVKIRVLQSETESESNASKRELHIQSPKQVEYRHLNTSLIVNGFQILNAFFDHEVTFKLIFRASNHNFSVHEFHEMCDGYEDTLTLCLTEDNKIIGGYTPLTWEENFHKNSTHFKTDFKRETFLFSVTDKSKYPLVKSLKNKATCCFRSYGPTFGGGYDLLIGDKSNELPNTTSYFPRNFEHPQGPNFNKRDFTGTSRKNFKLQEWEVFHVIKIHSLKTVENMHFTQSNSGLQTKKEPNILQRFKTAARQFYSSLCSDA